MSEFVLDAAVMLCLGGAAPALAESRRQHDSWVITVLPDRTVEMIQTVERTAFSPSAIGNVSTALVKSSDRQVAELVEAYTRKADGRIVPADPADFGRQEGRIGPDGSDTGDKTIRIPFRDVSVGDTTVISTKITDKYQYIGKDISQTFLVLPTGAPYRLDVRLMTPVSMPIRHDENLFSYEEKSFGYEIERHWFGEFNLEAIAEEGLVDLNSFLPNLAFSTFESYEALSNAYFSQIKDKPRITSGIQKLADEVTLGLNSPWAQAEAIFNWVSSNIRYVAVYSGSDRVIPNDSETTLARRFGDCKDQMILMSALLAARGIASEYVLIGQNRTSRLRETPMMGTFDHLIIYIPVFDTYADPTSPYSLFGKLPRLDMDKPVVRVSAGGAVVTRTPFGGPDFNTARIHTRLSIADDGAQRGETSVEATGWFAEVSRQFVAREEARPLSALTPLAKEFGLMGEVSMMAAPWRKSPEPYRFTTSWKTERPAPPVDKGWTAPHGLSPVYAEIDFLLDAQSEKRIYPDNCAPGRVLEDVDLELPENVKPVLPEEIAQTAREFSYRRSWSFEGRMLTVRTELEFTPKNWVCQPDLVNDVVAAMKAIKSAADAPVQFVRQK